MRGIDHKILKAVAAVTYKEWAAYRSHMLISIFVGPVYFLVQYYIWQAIYTTNSSISGFSLDQMLVYYGITILIHYCTMDFADWNFQMLIRTGKFAAFLLRPMDHRFFALSQKIGHRILGFFFEFLPVYLIMVLVFRLPLIPARPFWFALSLIFSFLLMFYVNYCVGMTAFWLIRADGIRRMLLMMRDIFAGVFLPLTFFPMIFQKLLFWMPFQFITYVPIRVFMGSYELAGISMSIPMVVGLQGVMVGVVFGLSELMWRSGIRQFTGVGV